MIEEGYIKFQCELITADPPKDSRLKHLNQWRTRLHEIGLIGVYPDGIGFGNTSLRTGGDQFIISGTATGKYPVLSEDHYVLVDSFNLEQNTLTCHGKIQASSESMTHGAIYQSNPQFMFVLHIHHPGIWQHYMDKIPTTSAEISYGTPAMASALAEITRSPKEDPTAIVMGGHTDGVIVCGSSLDQTGALLMKMYKTLS